jgi:membrane protease YdiL (CAAX protease family)
VVVLVALAIVAIGLRATPASLYLRRPARRWIPWAIGGFLVAGPIALLVGPFLARPFFGDVSFTFLAGALVPALVFAVSNGLTEEVIYRGALMSWSGRVIGIGPAMVGQAVVFGLAHSGSDVIGLQVPLMLAMGIGGLLAGLVTVRTRSLLIPIAVHIGLDIPIYFALACRQ